MTPWDLCKSNSEHGHQRALFAFLNMAEVHGFAAAWEPASYSTHPDKVGGEPVPELTWAHAIPNGGARGDDPKSAAIRGATLKAEGVKRGIPDVFVPVPLWGIVQNAASIDRQDVARCILYAGLYVEMKRPKAEGQRKGSTSGEQDQSIAYLRHMGYAVSVCFDWESAAREVQSYVEAVRRGSGKA